MKINITRLMDTNNFNLESDLLQLKKVIKVDAIEAIVFYSGRILEATSMYCVNCLGEKAKSNVFANIEYINDYKSLLDGMTRSWAHALRRLANQFRHILKATEKDDGQIAIILLDTWLTWLFNSSPFVNNNKHEFSLLEDTKNSMQQQFRWVGDWLKHKDIKKINIDSNSSILKQPVFASLICEALINKKEYSKATKYLKVALLYHSDDLRLNQLKGLLFSRTGKLLEAESILRSLLKKFPNDDETIGILGGVIKSLWMAGDKNKLWQWGKLYIQGWNQSDKRNTYLGINAAAYYLWSGDVKSCNKLAQEIVQQYSQKEKSLKNILKIKVGAMDYWDQASLAEAFLLADKPQKAEKAYKILFSSKIFKNEPHNIPAKQLRHHLSIANLNSTKAINKLAMKY